MLLVFLPEPNSSGPLQLRLAAARPLIREIHRLLYSSETALRSALSSQNLPLVFLTCALPESACMPSVVCS